GRALGTPGGSRDGFRAKYQDHDAGGPGVGRVLFENNARTQMTPARKPKSEAAKLEFSIRSCCDSYEFQRELTLKIGGVTLPHPKGLSGHSYGDVLLHALTDALLGAVAAPDIGSLFSPSNPKWKGADSAVFLREALERIRSAGYTVANVDSTLILAAPKIGPHAAAI